MPTYKLINTAIDYFLSFRGSDFAWAAFDNYNCVGKAKKAQNI
jgi:hypothetical protein